jgi:hypothetical protein
MKPAQSSANKKTMRRKQKTLSIWTKASIAVVRNATAKAVLNWRPERTRAKD